MRKIYLVVLDSVGIGELPDAASFGDAGSNTLVNTARAVGGLNLPTLEKWGLGNLVTAPGLAPTARPQASCGRMAEASSAKDTVTGHWELAGLISDHSFTVYPDGFPPDFIAEFEHRTGSKTLVNKPYSGTQILTDYGREHLTTGALLVYTSADSVFQIAAHEELVAVDELYRICELAREMLDERHVARVIARPFIGSPDSFTRTYNRKDFCMEPFGPTLLDYLSNADIPVWGVGKIKDIFAGRGITRSIHTEGNRDGFETICKLQQEMERGLLFANLVDFDTLYGHRRDPEGYARALEEADSYLPRIAGGLDRDDLLVVTADHGCDPTHRGHTDHTREYVPVLVYGPSLPPVAVQTRETFADLAASLSSWFGLKPFGPGAPFPSDDRQ